MKVVLLVSLLFSLSLCDETTGGWKKLSFNSNDAVIYRALQTAEAYYKKITGSTEEIIGLTVYSQVVNGVNYRICFVDPNNSAQSIFEYTLYKPLPTEEGNEINFSVSGTKTYEPSEGLLNFDDPLFTKIEVDLKYAFSKMTNTFKFINFIYPIKNDVTTFYIIRATTTEGEKNIIFAKDEENDVYYPPVTL